MAPSSSSSKVTPRQQSRVPRSANTQPTYDFLAAAEDDGAMSTTAAAAAPPGASKSQLAVRAASASRPDIANEDLRTQLRTLRYDVEALRQAREVARVQHEQELREARARAEAEFGRAQAAEHAKNAISIKYDTQSRELKLAQEHAANDKHAFEKKVRALQEENRSLKDDVGEAQSEAASMERQHKHQLQSVSGNQATLQQSLEEAQAELERKTTALQASQTKQAEQELELARLEEELLRLRTQGGDVEEVVIVRRELSEQVAHIRRLEKTGRDQGAELRHFRQMHKSVQIVEEEKRALEIQVQRMDDLQRELGEAQFQREILENERRSWAAYLADSEVHGEIEFESPEAVVKALVRERMEKASLLERLGAVQPQISEKEAIIQSLEKDRAALRTDIEKARAAGGGGDARARSRLERQKALAVKEIAYLREQLKTFESEDTEDIHAQVTEASRTRIHDLEALVEQYRAEIDVVNTELSKRDAQEPPPPQGLKRPAPEDADERVGELSRKNRQLQSDLSALHESASILQADLSATKSQLSSLQASSKTRILALRNNPTDDFHHLKYSTIAALRTENAALLAQLQGTASSAASSAASSVPAASLAALRLELAERDHAVAEHALMLRRLKTIFAQKTTEFREAVASILGWRMEFTPAGKFRLTSIFHPGADGGNDDGTGNTTNGIIFDGEKGEMKFIGGPESDFAREVRGLVKFWVHERGEMPAFMAACQLEFYEKSTRALRM